jgi:hypothetical protein
MPAMRDSTARRAAGGSAAYCSLSSAGKGRESLRKPAVFYGFMRTGEIKFQKAVMARGFQGPRQQPLCRLTDGQIRDEDSPRTRRLATATWPTFIDIMGARAPTRLHASSNNTSTPASTRTGVASITERLPLHNV